MDFITLEFSRIVVSPILGFTLLARAFSNSSFERLPICPETPLDFLIVDWPPDLRDLISLQVF